MTTIHCDGCGKVMHPAEREPLDLIIPLNGSDLHVRVLFNWGSTIKQSDMCRACLTKAVVEGEQDFHSPVGKYK